MALDRIFAALLSATLVAGPALAQEAPPAAPAAPAPPAAPAAPAAAPATTGRIYVSYPVQPHGDFPSQLAIDDAYQSDALAPGTCVTFDLPPGQHSVHTLVDPTLNFDLKADDAKYVELHVRHVYREGKPDDSIYPTTVTKIDNQGACKAGTP